MVQVAALLRRQHDGVACVACSFFAAASNTCSDGTKNSYSSKLSSMAEEPSRAVTQEEKEQAEEEGVGRDQEQDVPSSSSRDWLQLGLGTSSSAPHERRPVSTELQLFRDRPSPPLQMPWGRRGSTESIGGSSSTPAHTIPEFATGSSGASAAAAAEALAGERVVSPPRRQADLWFILQAAQNQGRQPFLPQIPKNYLRIKDGRMTVRLLMKYLANKLALEGESEVEITCRDQLLPPSLTLQYVRDNIWSSGDPTSILPDSPTIDHVMTLQYRRRP